MTGEKATSLKLQCLENKDRISSLPDDVLCHILSFLPTIYAVHTSILSSRWRFLWTSVPNLDFCDRVGPFVHDDAEGARLYMNFVDRVLLFHNVRPINRFYLKISKWYDLSRVNAWISTAIWRDVVDLEFGNRTFSSRDEFQLPRCLFSCKKLQVLKLSGNIVFRVPKSVSLPSLKVLHLTDLRHLDGGRIRNLLSGSPKLEELVIIRHSDDKERKLYVRSCSLKGLTIHDSNCVWSSISHYEVVVDAPKLEYLELWDRRSSDLNMICVSSLIKAYICAPLDSSKPFADRASILIKLLTQISHIKVLCISANSLMVLDEGCQNNLAAFHNLPSFHNLTRLEVFAAPRFLSFLEILKRSPKLKALLFVIEGWRYYGRKLTWNPPESVPECLLSCLEIVEFTSFFALDVEMEIVEYLLKNATVLEKMTITYNSESRKSKLETIVKFLSFPRASSSCRILIS